MLGRTRLAVHNSALRGRKAGTGSTGNVIAELLATTAGAGNQGFNDTGRRGGPFTQHDQGSPGRYLFGPGEATPGYYVSAAMIDGRDVLGQAVELSSPTTVKLVLKKDGGTVRGTVEKGGGSTVVLVAEPTPYARFGLTARCDPDGKFSISDVPPGNYTAVAFQDYAVLYQPDMLSRIDSAHGERVKVEAGGSETVALKVN